jgi:predicted Zn-dependent protease
MAKGSFIQGLVGAAGVVGGGTGGANAASYVGNIYQMKYGRNDELESDEWGLMLMMMAGYKEQELLGVMDILEDAGGAGGTPEFLSTHPRPKNRKAHIEQVLKNIEERMTALGEIETQAGRGNPDETGLFIQ